jgi:uncharacterized protein (DUF1684 family)
MSDLEDFRARKDEFLKADPDSPLEPEQRRLFHALEYFPELPALRFVVEPQRLPERETIRYLTARRQSTSAGLGWSSASMKEPCS